MASSRIPTLVKHCVLAIYNTDKTLQGSAKARVRSALKIAQARLVEYGFLTAGSENRPPDQVGLTAKGIAREQMHDREGPAKNKAFEALYRLVETDFSKKAERGDAARDTKPSAPHRKRP